MSGSRAQDFVCFVSLLTLVLWRRTDKSPWHPWVFQLHTSCFLVALTGSRCEQWKPLQCKAVYLLGVGENNKESGEESREILSYIWAAVGKEEPPRQSQPLGRWKDSLHCSIWEAKGTWEYGLGWKGLWVPFYLECRMILKPSKRML